jgi:hypothetical protein
VHQSIVDGHQNLVAKGREAGSSLAAPVVEAEVELYSLRHWNVENPACCHRIAEYEQKIIQMGTTDSHLLLSDLE